ncbi:unnamed protein product [Bathycoccus prasinos]|mmetsp:Transcript_5880/g.19725  ORF Transcript_5880/g.19725 Transcript_5880/m.19725 type:complete len:732 (+) Transcript_5880:310-2505(+)
MASSLIPPPGSKSTVDEIVPLNKQVQNVKFVSFTQERDDYSANKARKGTKFYLVDEDSIPHLAIIGDEREQRDGHYSYRVSEEFANPELGIPPLKQGNLVGVRKWLKDRITQSAQQYKKRMMLMNSNGGNDVGMNGENAGGKPTKETKIVALSAAQLTRKKKQDIPDGASLIDHDAFMNASLRARKLEEKEFKWASTKENAFAFIRGTEVFEDLKAETRTVKVEDLEDENDDGYENQANHQVRENARALVEDAIAKIIKHSSSSKLSVVSEVIEALKTLKSSRLHLKRIATDEYAFVDALKRLREDGKNARRSSHISTASKLASDLLKHIAGSIVGSVGALISSYDRAPPPAPPRVKPGYLVQLVDAAGNVISQTDVNAPTTTRAFAANAATTNVINATALAQHQHRTATGATAGTAAAIPTLPPISPPSLRNRGAGSVQIKEEPHVQLPPSTATKKKTAAAAVAASSKHNKGTVGPGGKRKLKDILASSPSSYDTNASQSSKKKKQRQIFSRNNSFEQQGGTGTTEMNCDTATDDDAANNTGTTAKSAAAAKSLLGKGRKRCHVCSTVVGSPTRVCPHCKTALPMKVSASTKKEKAALLEGKEKNAALAKAAALNLQSNGGGKNSPAADIGESMLEFRRIFTNCKPSVLKVGAQKLIAELKERLDENSAMFASELSPGSAMNTKFILEELMQPLLEKVETTKLFNGANERPKGRRELLEALDAFIASYYS